MLQFRRWTDAGCFEAMVSEMRSINRVGVGHKGQPSAVILEGRTLQSSCESGPRAGYNSYKLRRGSKVHVVVDTLGQLVGLTVMQASEYERVGQKDLCKAVQQVTSETMKIAWTDQGYTGDKTRKAPKAAGIDHQIVKLSEAKKEFFLLPRRWVVERSFGRLSRFRRLSRDFERMPHVLSGLHFVVFCILILPKVPFWMALKANS